MLTHFLYHLKLPFIETLEKKPPQVADTKVITKGLNSVCPLTCCMLELSSIDVE